MRLINVGGITIDEDQIEVIDATSIGLRSGRTIKLDSQVIANFNARRQTEARQQWMDLQRQLAHQPSCGLMALIRGWIGKPRNRHADVIFAAQAAEPIRCPECGGPATGHMKDPGDPATPPTVGAICIVLTTDTEVPLRTAYWCDRVWRDPHTARPLVPGVKCFCLMAEAVGVLCGTKGGAA